MLKGFKAPTGVVYLCLFSLLSCGTGNKPNVEASDPASATKLLVSDDFESGNFAKWSFLWTAEDVTINSDPSHVRGGAYSAQLHYQICSSCGAAHQDTNRFLQAQFNAANGFPGGLNHALVRGSVYFKLPEPGGSVDIQRKVFYIKSPSGPSGTPNAYWSVVLTSDGLISTNQIQLYLLMGNSALGGTTTRLWTAVDPAHWLEFNRWYDLQVEVQANTPGIANGRIALWLDGTKVFEQDSLNIRRDSALGIDRVEVGSQSDRLDYRPVDEYRYWDNLKISESHDP